MTEVDRSREALAIFLELVEQPEPAARARLEALEAKDAALAAAVRDLVAADSEAGAFLSGGIADYSPRFAATDAAAGADSLAGQAVGPYVLETLLGRGGMGEVWSAERRDGQFEQRVALKLLKRGVDSEGVRRRFLQERQVLAGLDHQNIARLLDGGEAGGRPYFVMELVEGQPITDYCRTQRLSLSARVALVANCCEAVAAAHRRLVVHRDLKPSNVLVTTDGRVKLLDFGIAKILSEEADATQTRADERVLTPSYAAPEQILGETVTTATDVYALGVVLYELLTGALPHQRGDRPATHLVTAVEKETVERPSRAAARTAASAGPPEKEGGRWPRMLEDDLDAIVLKALRREPERRYAGAAELGEDLRRHLAGERVVARPDTLGYRTGKFVRRHRAGVAAAGLVVAALVAGMTAALWQAHVARANARRAERVQEFLVGIFQGSDPSRALGEKVTARELLASGTRRIETDLKGEPEVQAALYDAVAQIQCHLGAVEEARKLSERSLAERRRLFGDGDPRTMQSLVTLAEVQATVADEKKAEPSLRRALPALAAAYGADAEETMRAKDLLANVLVSQGVNAEALSLAEELVASKRRRFGDGSPEAAETVSLVGMIQESMSQYDDAEKAYRQAAATFDRTVGSDDPRASNAHALLAEILSYRGRRAEAEKEFAITLAAQRKSLGPEHPEVAGTLVDLGFLYMNERRYAEADAALEESLRIYRSIGDADGANPLRILAISLTAQERYAEARQKVDECLRIARERFGEEHQITLTALGNLGEIELRSGDLSAADATLQEAVAGLEKMFGEDADNLRAPLNNFGELRRMQGRRDEAEELHRRALAIQLKAVGPDNPSVPGTRYQLALDLLADPTPARLAEARVQLDQAMALTRRVDAGHPRLDDMLAASGRAARLQGDDARARRELAEALERLEEHRGAGDPRTRQARLDLAALGRAFGS